MLVNPPRHVRGALCLQLLDKELDDLLSLERRLRVLLHAHLLHRVLEPEEVLDVQRGRLVEARPLDVVGMRVVATAFKDLDAGGKCFVCSLNV